jgi:hypothetical protein
MGVAASAGAKAFTHSITFGITFAALSNIAQYVYHKRAGLASGEKRRVARNERKGINGPPRPHHLAMWGAFYLTALSVPLVMADLTRHVLQDSGYWESACPYNTEKECVSASKTTEHSSCYWTTHDTAPPGECVNSDFWKPGSSMYYGSDDKLSIVGVIFTVILTWSGYICLIVGVIWSANIHLKLKEIRDQWRELRGSRS